MHQTFYIDIDEEITMLVERLRNAKAEEVVFVVPKRALLLQGVVNLKILKKEADKLEKEVLLVTQDPVGKILAEKLGLLSFGRLEEVSGEEMEGDDEEEIEEEKVPKVTADHVGSMDYLDSKPGLSLKTFRGGKSKKTAPAIKVIVKDEKNEEPIVNTELVSIKAERRINMDLGQPIKEMKIEEEASSVFQEDLEEDKSTVEPLISEKNNHKKSSKIASHQSEKIVKLFQNRPATDFFSEPIKQKKKPVVSLNWSFSTKFWGVLAIFVMIGLGALAYLFLPKATITLFAKSKTENIDLEVQAKNSVTESQIDQKIIPLRSATESGEIQKDFVASGFGPGSGQKARGSLTIYNEFGQEAQPLVATTRFMTEDGKIFRLVKGVTVPGMKNGAAGSIEAEVVADEPGENYNISSSKFVIPGFQDNKEKYSKFYAQSLGNMQGGSNGSQIKAVTKNDLEKAKDQMREELVKSLSEKINQKLSPDEKLLEEAINLDKIDFVTSANEGSVSDTFSLTAKGEATALIFSQNLIKTMAMEAINKANPSYRKLTVEQISLQYGKSDIDFSRKEIVIRVSALGKLVVPIDLDKMKRQILGKGEDDLMAYLKDYPQIDRAEISYWPTFIDGKIPAFVSRVEISLDNN